MNHVDIAFMAQLVAHSKFGCTNGLALFESCTVFSSKPAGRGCIKGMQSSQTSGPHFNPKVGAPGLFDKDLHVLLAGLYILLFKVILYQQGKLVISCVDANCFWSLVMLVDGSLRTAWNC